MIRVCGATQLLATAGTSPFLPARGGSVCDLPLQRIVFGSWGAEPAEEVVVVRISESDFEVQCHGGDAAVRRILADLAARGCRIVSWQVLERGQSPVLEAECRERLALASTLRTAQWLLRQATGALRGAVQEVGNALHAGRPAEAVSRLRELLAWSEFGRHLSEPWQVVILGRPNVGKSSLLNALAGFQRAIVFDEPGTTRDVVSVEIALAGWPVRLLDTAGLRQGESALECAGIALAREQALSAELRLLVVDASQPPGQEDLELLADWPGGLVVANKADLANAWADKLPAGAVCVSARTGLGLDDLAEHLVRRLIPQMPPDGAGIPVTALQISRLEQALELCAAGNVTGSAAVLADLLGHTA